jgi:hypothetical protein
LLVQHHVHARSGGSRGASITIVSSGTGSPQSIAVTGMGNSAGGGGETTAMAVEYYHAAFDHYFVTAIQDEITKLDNGTFVGWARTGKQFKIYVGAGTGLSGVCRFFSTTFDPKSSHFYTADTNECTVVKANKDWLFEAVVFYVPVPTRPVRARSAPCPSSGCTTTARAPRPTTGSRSTPPCATT